jgi:hypothetical protein
MSGSTEIHDAVKQGDLARIKALLGQSVILANGGELVRQFIKPPQFGSKPALRFRIAL